MFQLSSAAASRRPIDRPPPRRVTIRPGRQGIPILPVVFIAPHTVAGLGLVILAMGHVGSLAGAHTPALVAFAIVWNAVVVLLHWQFWFVPWRQRRLLIGGVAVPGVIVSVQRRQIGREGRALIAYRYRPRNAAHEVYGQLEVSDAVMRSLPARDITVFHDADAPHRSLVYEAAPWTIGPG